MTEQLRGILKRDFPPNGDKMYSNLWRIAAAAGFPVGSKKRPGSSNLQHQYIPQETVIQLQAMTKEELTSLMDQARYHNVGGLPSRANQDEIIQKYVTALKNYRQDLDRAFFQPLHQRPSNQRFQLQLINIYFRKYLKIIYKFCD